MTAYLKRLRAPLWLRMFGVQFLVVIGVTTIVMGTFGNEGQRVLVRNAAPLWAQAIGEVLAQHQGGGEIVRHVVSRDIRLRVTALPEDARRIEHEARYDYWMEALRAAGLPVADVRVQDHIEEPVTWIAVEQRAGEWRWVGVVDNMQVPRFQQRWRMAVLMSLGLLALMAWWQSRSVVRPIKRLMKSLDAIGRDEVPQINPGGSPEFRRLGTALESMAREAADRDAQRRLMLAGISHDLRSPLARIRLAADLMEQEPEARERIMCDVDLADRMLGEFLLYVRAEAELLNDDVDLGLIAREAARAHGLDDAAVQTQPVPRLRAHALLLRRAIDNLLDNAQQYGAAPITVQIAVEQDAVVCAVSDAGLGIAPGDVERLLRPFERGEVHRGTPGTGLGLAIVNRIVRKHGGQLRVERGVNGGARMCLVFPLR